jgi:stalled ribosome rescue protein Dom34
MPVFHALVWLDHHHAEILQFDATQVLAQQVKSDVHYTRHHDSKTRSEHEFFAEICEALADVDQLLVVGSPVAQAEFRRYVDKFRPLVAARVVHVQTLGHPSNSEMIGLARRYFSAHSDVVA